MPACPSCGEELAADALVYCDQCGAAVAGSGLLMLGSSIGAGSPARVEAELARPSEPTAQPPERAPQRFVPFASLRALHSAP